MKRGMASESLACTAHQSLHLALEGKVIRKKGRKCDTDLAGGGYRWCGAGVTLRGLRGSLVGIW